MFHLIAKFLYNKRKVSNKKQAVYLNKAEQLRRQDEIYFDIQKVVQLIVLSGVRFDLFIHQHIPDYYFSVLDLAGFYEQLCSSDC